MESATGTRKLLQDVPVNLLKGVGDSLAGKLAKLELFSVQDLVFHLPLRYQDRTRITPLGSLQPNMEAVVEGEVRGCEVVYRGRRSLLCVIQDGTGSVALRFYHFSNAQKEGLKTGRRLRCYGEARRGAAGLEFYHPEYTFLDGGSAEESLEQTLTPVYPTTEGLGQQRLRKLIQQALGMANEENVPELLSDFTEKRPKAISLLEALHFLHAPPRDAPLNELLEGQHPCQQRLAFEELLAHHLSLLKVRARIQRHRSQPLQRDHLRETFLKSLPFPLTGAQLRVASEIAEDLARPFPMLRLVQGDVGSGKTLVAALAALQAVASGTQAALMAPTEILAEQHRLNFDNWLSPLGIEVAALTGRQKAAEKRRQLARVADDEAKVVIGTHALIQSDVAFANLGLIIIDEQHRFGVQQRLSLRNARQQEGESLLPHQLIMTATPIPRTLAMSAYADLDCSVIDELPPGRSPVETVVISNERRAQVVERVSEACRHKRQAYWVCTLIEESEVLEAQAAEATAEELSAALPHLRVALLHGRVKPQEKERIMDAFKDGAIDLLVATTVIEVGVDVPNASLMIIENPERLGLAQLHQLRGRVGRGSAASHCVLLYGSPLSTTAKARLQVMRSSNDGFVIAEKDLEIRGPGEVLGTRQTGQLQFKVADLQRDAHLLGKVRALAVELQQRPELSNALTRRWVGRGQEYGGV
ncbi:ATP-dependent DNA helicase RecG [Gilvimarinus sp. F26214L]|uniref:ATP-dependent DNA helicase RecG n=1 Tax=Gilvimarinus sp. DZF01 TaxID=3461371 RepID=UPI004045DC07